MEDKLRTFQIAKKGIGVQGNLGLRGRKFVETAEGAEVRRGRGLIVIVWVPNGLASVNAWAEIRSSCGEALRGDKGLEGATEGSGPGMYPPSAELVEVGGYIPGRSVANPGST
ncbi:MAG: hypothetical protein AAFV07_13920 [Bacteroidota bacterium]